MNKYFFNKSENRLKAGWRILFFLIIFWTLASAIFIIKPLLGDITKKEYLDNYSIIIISVLALAATISVFIARKFLDKKPFISLGLILNKQSLKDVLFGFCLSFLMAGLFFLIALGFGLIEFNGFNFGQNPAENSEAFDFVRFMSVISVGSVLILLTEHILVGYWEELVFRGYVFQNFIDGMGLKTAIILSCLIYGIIHATNPHASLLSSSIIVLFGFLRIYGYLATKTLWLSIGMHIGWNFFQGPVFGFGASGHQKVSIINNTSTSSDWLSGGEFGPEGSILIIPILVLALVVMRWWAHKTT